jgi:hypothetical protein
MGCRNKREAGDIPVLPATKKGSPLIFCSSPIKKYKKDVRRWASVREVILFLGLNAERISIVPVKGFASANAPLTDREKQERHFKRKNIIGRLSLVIGSIYLHYISLAVTV